MSTVAIPNIDIKVWTRTSEFLVGNYQYSLTQHEIIRQIIFELMEIQYDRIKDRITRMEHAEYDTSMGRNVMNVDDKEYFANL